MAGRERQAHDAHGDRAGAAFAALGSPSPSTRDQSSAGPAWRADAPDFSRDTGSALVAALNAQQPEVLVGAAGIWRALAEEIAGRLRIAPRAAFFSSEPLTADVRRRVRDAWGIEPVSGYAATEAPTIAASSPEHPELEIAEDVVVVEIVDEDGRPVPPGRPGAKVLLTNLINYAQPLIRYELTDSVLESPAPQSRGSALALPALGGWAYCGHPLSPRPRRRDGRGPSFRTRVGCRAHRRGWRVFLRVRRAGATCSGGSGPGSRR